MPMSVLARVLRWTSGHTDGWCDVV